MAKSNNLFLFAAICGISLFSCGERHNGEAAIATESMDSTEKYYEKMKSQIHGEDDSEFQGTSETNEKYDPMSAEASQKLIDRGRTYMLDSTIEVRFDVRTTAELSGNSPEDTLRVGNETFTRDLRNITELDLYNLRHNLDYVKETKDNTATDGDCSGKDCPVYAHVNKKEQRLYLFLNGEPLDTFKTSTARSGYKTPDFNKKPDGRIYTKYSSHKYHGGDWNGLGNMPYAVFIEGGYAIHGATPGEIHELGKPASHGCVRLHPKNAKLFNKLVKYAGVENTWVHVTED